MTQTVRLEMKKRVGSDRICMKGKREPVEVKKREGKEEGRINKWRGGENRIERKG